MRERDRKILLRRLDVEMRSIRRAGIQKDATVGLLRAVRQALRIPVDEIMEKMGVGWTSVFNLETSEMRQTASLKSMDRMAKAMGCKVVYGIVPNGGKKLEDLVEERYLAGLIGTGNREQGTGNRE
jgi:hypothetical protein